MVEIKKSYAIILKKREYSNTSLLLTAFSRDFGKLSLLAKGIKKAKDKRFLGIDIFCDCEILFTGRGLGSLNTLTDFDVLESFRGIRNDLQRVRAAQYTAGLVDNLVEVGERNELLYDVLRFSLESLAKGADFKKIVAYAQLKLVQLLGYYPDFTRCAECGAATGPGGDAQYSPLKSEVRCERCARGKGGDDAFRISPEFIAASTFLAGGGTERCATLMVSNGALRELLRVFFGSIVTFSERMPPMADFVGALIHEQVGS